MSRLPLLTPDEIRVELAQISDDIGRLWDNPAPGIDATLRRLERYDTLTRWQNDLQKQLAAGDHA